MTSQMLPNFQIAIVDKCHERAQTDDQSSNKAAATLSPPVLTADEAKSQSLETTWVGLGCQSRTLTSTKAREIDASLPQQLQTLFYQEKQSSKNTTLAQH
jgi:hypothetical protein